MKRWTPEEEALMLRYYPVASRQYMAELLGRSVYSVVTKAKAMRIQRVRRYTRPKVRRHIPDHIRRQMVAMPTYNTRHARRLIAQRQRGDGEALRGYLIWLLEQVRRAV